MIGDFPHEGSGTTDAGLPSWDAVAVRRDAGRCRCGLTATMMDYGLRIWSWVCNQARAEVLPWSIRLLIDQIT